MKAPIEKNQETQTDVLTHQSNFNFELWAKQVRPQLLASVQKRGLR